KNNALYALTVLPGYDDTVIRKPGFKVPRSDGATYSYTWNTVLEHDPKWVFICSWNEWHEGTEIEPSFEEGFKYLNLTKQYIDKFKEKE
ncbi:MAG: glycoside hydrolase family 99-like domain-containing protein, partial [Thermofilaceae archaeon]